MLSENKMIVSVPKSFRFIFCSKENILLLICKDNYLLIKTLKNVYVCKKKNLICFFDTSKTFKNNSFFLINKFLRKGTLKYSVKISLKGVGYKFLIVKKSILQILVGFSHSIFIKLSDSFTILHINSSTIVLTCGNFSSLRRVSYFIKSFKKPDSYKGKGILFDYEKLKLKEGKKAQQ